jgi:hypothetical protein
MNPAAGRWIRRTSPALAGVALVLMLHGDFLLSVVFAILFFFAYVGSDWRFLIGQRPRPEHSRPDDEEHRDA